MRRFPRLTSSITALFIPVLAVGLSFISGGILIFISGQDPFLAFSGLFEGALGDGEAIFRTLERATPLIWNGLALTLAFKAGLFNIGVQGQFLLGAIFAAAIGAFVAGLPPLIHLGLALAGGMAAGAIFGIIQGGLKAYRGSHEVITGIMLNYTAINLTDYLTKGPFMDTANGNLIPRTPMVIDACRIPEIFFLPSGFFTALLFAAGLFLFLEVTVKGFEIKAVGEGRDAARSAAGIRVSFMTVLVMGASGCLAGMGGAIETLGVTGRFQPGFNPGLGFEGITIALLARLHPIGVIPSALLLGGMKAGAGNMQFASDVPTEILDMMVAMILFFVAADKLMGMALPFKKTTLPALSLSAGWGSR